MLDKVCLVSFGPCELVSSLSADLKEKNLLVNIKNIHE